MSSAADMELPLAALCTPGATVPEELLARVAEEERQRRKLGNLAAWLKARLDLTALGSGYAIDVLNYHLDDEIGVRIYWRKGGHAEFVNKSSASFPDHEPALFAEVRRVPERKGIARCNISPRVLVETTGEGMKAELEPVEQVRYAIGWELDEQTGERGHAAKIRVVPDDPPKLSP